jgi:hypothetical protein
VAALALVLIGLQTSAADKAPPDKKTTVEKPTIEFQGIFEGADNTKRHSLSVIVGLTGSSEELTIEVMTNGNVTARALAISFANQIKANPDWKYSLSADENVEVPKLVIEGWTDPKTKKLHQVKSIEFKSPDLPKDCWPTIKMPANL